MENAHAVHEVYNFLNIIPTCIEMFKTKEAAIVHLHEFESKHNTNNLNKPLHFAVRTWPVFKTLISSWNTSENNNKYKVQEN